MSALNVNITSIPSYFNNNSVRQNVVPARMNPKCDLAWGPGQTSCILCIGKEDMNSASVTFPLKSIDQSRSASGLYAGVNSPPRPPRLLSDMCIACVKYMCYEFDGHTCAWLIWLLEAKGRGCCSCSLVKPYDKIYGSIFSMFLFMSLNVTFVTRPSDVQYATTSMIEYPYCLPPQRNSIIV